MSGIYKATVRGVPNLTVMLTDRDTDDPWVSMCMDPARAVRWRWHRHDQITDARPLIVLDLGDKPPSVVVNSLRDASNSDHLHSASALELMDIADQIEAQTKPARIPEPGRWAVVEASYRTSTVRYEWVHHPNGWHCPAEGWVSWRTLTDPVLVRDGIES